MTRAQVTINHIEKPQDNYCYSKQDARVPPWITMTIENNIYYLSQCAMRHMLGHKNQKWTHKHLDALVPELEEAFAIDANPRYESKNYCFLVTEIGGVIYDIQRKSDIHPRTPAPTTAQSYDDRIEATTNQIDTSCKLPIRFGNQYTTK